MGLNSGNALGGVDPDPDPNLEKSPDSDLTPWRKPGFGSQPRRKSGSGSFPPEKSGSVPWKQYWLTHQKKNRIQNLYPRKNPNPILVNWKKSSIKRDNAFECSDRILIQHTDSIKHPVRAESGSATLGLKPGNAFGKFAQPQ